VGVGGSGSHCRHSEAWARMGNNKKKIVCLERVWQKKGGGAFRGKGATLLWTQLPLEMKAVNLKTEKRQRRKFGGGRHSSLGRKTTERGNISVPIESRRQGNEMPIPPFVTRDPRTR